jgi:hypothetical protein
LSSRPRIPARSVVVVGPVDRFRIDRWSLGRRHHSAGWLSHSAAV